MIKLISEEIVNQTALLMTSEQDTVLNFITGVLY